MRWSVTNPTYRTVGVRVPGGIKTILPGETANIETEIDSHYSSILEGAGVVIKRAKGGDDGSSVPIAPALTPAPAADPGPDEDLEGLSRDEIIRALEGKGATVDRRKGDDTLRKQLAAMKG